ncbi:MAG: hypothetical protein RLZ98_2233 [Pseudomonadota bacterium]|jgi:hypothetical protein
MRFICLLLAALSLIETAHATEPPDFKSKTISIIVPFRAGGGTDAAARLIATMIANELPGKPKLIVRNIPGGGGLPAVNYFVQQTQPDGLTMVMGSSSLSDPINYRKPQSKFDTTKFQIVGGVGRGGSLLILRRDAEPRLLDKSKPPVIMGSIGGIPRFSLQMTAWGIELLGWNAKWVVGYPGTDDLMLAIDRGEVDMTATSNMFQIMKLTDGAKFMIIAQTGSPEGGRYVPRPEAPKVPVFNDMVAGRIADPIAGKAFAYWKSVSSIDKWVALASATPPDITSVYREAFVRVVGNPMFKVYGRKISQDFEAMAWADIQQIHDTLAATPPEAIAYIGDMLRRQGLKPE